MHDFTTRYGHVQLACKFNYFLLNLNQKLYVSE